MINVTCNNNKSDSNCVSVIFICGKPLYKIRKPNGNIAMDVAKCVSVSNDNVNL